jgi:hypothetical protein
MARIFLRAFRTIALETQEFKPRFCGAKLQILRLLKTSAFHPERMKP